MSNINYNTFDRINKIYRIKDIITRIFNLVNHVNPV